MKTEDKIKLTGLRKLVLDVVDKSKAPIKAYDILEKIKDSKYSAKPPTVYRSLDFLIENGLVHKIASSNSFIACQHLGDTKHNHFFITCETCSKTEEIIGNKIEREVIKQVDGSKYIINSINLEIKVKCSNC